MAFRFLRRVSYLWRQRQMDAELTEELAFHREMKQRELESGGMPTGDADTASRRALGNATLAREDAREIWIWRWLDDVLRDIGYAMRMLRRFPAFTVVVVLTLGLGIGANTAIVTIVNAVILRPLPFKASDRVVYIQGNVPTRPGAMVLRLPMRDLPQLRKSSKTLSRFSTVIVRPVVLGPITDDDPVKVPRALISPAAFDLLDARPILGRLFEAREEEPGRDPVVILSYAVWLTYFWGDPTIIGKPITVDGGSFTVVGVMPRGFGFPTPDVGIWMPMQLLTAGDSFTATIAWINDGVPLDAAAAELNALFVRMHPTFAGASHEGAPSPLKLVSVKDHMIGPVRLALLVMLAAVGLVLLIACSNVASLLLARSAARRREFAVRIALGATRVRLIRQVLTESVLLALLGGAFGCLVALGAVRLLTSLEADQIPRLAEVRVDASFLVIALTISLATSLLFGSAPSFRIANFRFERDIRDAGGVMLFGRNQFQSALTIMQVGLAVVLLIGAGLLGGSFLNLARFDLGYNPEHVLTFAVPMTPNRYPDSERNAKYAQLLERFQAMPHSAAAITGRLPTQPGGIFGGLLQLPESDQRIPAQVRPVSRGYLNVMRLHLVAGRSFDDPGLPVRPFAMLVSQEVAANFPDRQPLGKVVQLNGPFEGIPIQVVGIVDNVLASGLDATVRPDVYVNVEQIVTEPRFQRLLGPVSFVVRVKEDPMRIVPTVRGLVRQVDPRLFVDNVASMETLVSNTVARPRAYSALLGTFAFVAVLLAAIGTYGLTAYHVTERTPEIGIRMALGARRADVVRLVLTQTSSLVFAGILAGLGCAAALTRYLEAMLFGLTPLDPGTFVAVPVIFILVAGAACYMPVRRALNVDPIAALRSE